MDIIAEYSLSESDLARLMVVRLFPAIGEITACRLYLRAANAQELYEMAAAFSERRLHEMPSKFKKVPVRSSGQYFLDLAEKELEWAKKRGVKVLHPGHPDYPLRLLACPDFPLVLFLKGQSCLNLARSLAVVGTRKMTPYGQQKCIELLRDITPLNPLIVSGLAYGIDAQAHKSSLDYGLPTVAVMAHGLDRVYPPEHLGLARKMLDNGGALLSEYFSGNAPVREHFPKRNRIIAGLCDALVVVEAAKTGGALSTARLANEYARDVLTLPGRSTDICSGGCNGLLRRHLAHVMESVKDLHYQVSWGKFAAWTRLPRPEQLELFGESKENINKTRPAGRPHGRLAPAGLTAQQSRLLSCMTPGEEVPAGRLAEVSGIGLREIIVAMVNLELKGLIRAIPGQHYVLV